MGDLYRFGGRGHRVARDVVGGGDCGRALLSGVVGGVGDNPPGVVRLVLAADPIYGLSVLVSDVCFFSFI